MRAERARWRSHRRVSLAGAAEASRVERVRRCTSDTGPDAGPDTGIGRSLQVRRSRDDRLVVRRFGRRGNRRFWRRRGQNRGGVGRLGLRHRLAAVRTAAVRSGRRAATMRTNHLERSERQKMRLHYVVKPLTGQHDSDQRPQPWRKAPSIPVIRDITGNCARITIAPGVNTIDRRSTWTPLSCVRRSKVGIDGAFCRLGTRRDLVSTCFKWASRIRSSWAHASAVEDRSLIRRFPCML